MNFEVVCIDFIIKSCGLKWQEVLDTKIFNKIKERYDSLKDQDLDIDMLHCSFIDDKIEIIKKAEKFKDFCLVYEKDEGDIRYSFLHLIILMKPFYTELFFFYCKNAA